MTGSPAANFSVILGASYAYIHCTQSNANPSIDLQQLQLPRNSINNALRAQNSQHRPTPTRNLRPPSIMDHPRTKPKAHRLRLQERQLVLRLDLQRDLGLALAFPAAEDGRVRRVREEVFVAG
jgi:hypothetical protein